MRASASSPRQNLVDRAGIEPAAFRLSDGCTACRAPGRRSPARTRNPGPGPSYAGWSRRADSNRRLGFTRAPFFPLNYFDIGASGENRTLLTCLEGRDSANKSRPLDIQTLTSDCQRTHFDGSAGTVRSLQPRCALTRSFGRQTHWSGTPDSNRESHEPKSCGLSRFPSARRKAPVESKRAGLSTGPVRRIQILSHTGLWTAARNKGVDVRWLSSLRRCPELDSLCHCSLT